MKIALCALLLAGCSGLVDAKQFKAAEQWCAPHGGLWFVSTEIFGGGVEAFCADHTKISGKPPKD